jgi:P-type Ca2+ transporter type 2C
VNPSPINSNPLYPSDRSGNSFQGLKQSGIASLQQRYGKNVLPSEKSRRIVFIIKDLVTEPMFLLLSAACFMYFLLQEVAEGLIMLVAIVMVSAISVYQEAKSAKALRALKELTEPEVKVIRDGVQGSVAIEEIVPGDVLIIEEGNKVPADATILSANDLTVNESVITGESLPVEKDEHSNQPFLYQGSVINSGRCYAIATATGHHTVLGKIGSSIATPIATETLLQKQVFGLVKKLALFGIGAFLVIFAINFYYSGAVISSLLFGLTLAMAAIPEEIPVAFSSFTALGAFHMSRLGIITREPQVIENLGAITVICLDKTGTITENKMKVQYLYDFEWDELLEDNNIYWRDNPVLFYAFLASEVNPFDSMEIAIADAYKESESSQTMASATMIFEYPLEGHPPMMTHVYERAGTRIAAAKGGVERVAGACRLSTEEKEKVFGLAKTLALKGGRVIAVAGTTDAGKALPEKQDDFDWKFVGLVSLYDPPKHNVAPVLKQLYAAGIKVKMITGDYSETALTIATQAGLRNNGSVVTGEEIMGLSKEALSAKTATVDIFARVFPEAKLRVIEALKAGGEVVAMTGDGVNDGPALKSANIGIAMGRKGTNIARLSADIILTDDNLQRIVSAVEQGRRIFNNIRKAIRYIISIHIPIILTASIPLILGWKYPNIFTPVHVIFLELIMGPTCSIFFEREPVEPQLMTSPPVSRSRGLFTSGEIVLSMAQGLVVTLGVLMLYFYYMQAGRSMEAVRTVVFTTLILSNIVLTFTNRSFTQTLGTTIRYRNKLAYLVVALSVSFLLAIHTVPFLQQLFGLADLSFSDLLICIGMALGSTSWFEGYKALRRNKSIGATFGVYSDQPHVFY